MQLKRVAEAKLPTPWGDFLMVGFEEKPFRYISLVSVPSGSKNSRCCGRSGKVTSLVSIDGQ